MYATVMNEIAEEINKNELGVNTNNTSHPKLGCLLYMDDVVLISNSAQKNAKNARHHKLNIQKIPHSQVQSSHLFETVHYDNN